MPDPALLSALALFATVAGLFRGFAGFGSGLMMAPIITLFIEPRIAVPVLLILALAASVRLVPSVWGHWDVRRIVLLAVPAIVAIPIGKYLLVTLPAETMQKTIAWIVLATVIVLATGWRARREFGWPVIVPAGFLSGFLTGMGGVGGPPVVLVNIADSEAARARANVIGYFVISQVTAIAAFLHGGIIERETLWYAGTAIIPFFLAVHLGTTLFRPERGKMWRLLSLGILALAALTGLLADSVYAG